MKKRILIATASIITLLGIILLAVFANAAEADPELKIVGCNLSFQDNIYIKYAVNGSDLSDVKLLIWTSEQTSYEFGTQSAVLESTGTETVSGKPCKIYSYSSLTARMMTDYVYARAYVVKSGTAYYSAVKKYSILQYVLNKTGKTGTASTNQKLIDLLNAMIEYGSAAQIYAGYKADRLANADWYQVKVVGGTLDDLSTEGLYLAGDPVTMTAPATDDQGKDFSYWETDSGEVAGTEATLTVTVVSLNKTYTAVYGSEIPDVPPTGDSEGLAYSDNGDGTCTITGIGTCTDTVINVPSEINGLTVTAIGENAFKDQTTITKVILPDTITSIGRRAYYGCTNLKESNIPVNVSEIGNQPFYKSGIESLTYSSNCLSFSQDSSIFTISTLKNITFDTEWIPEYVCYNCTNLTVVVFNENVKWIGKYAFSGCSNLTYVTIPRSINGIRYHAFVGCPNLNLVYYNGTLEDWLNIGFEMAIEKDDNCGANPCNNGASLFLCGELLTEVVIPSSFERIYNGAFTGCESITCVVIPDSVTSIGDSAFLNCTNLVNITIPDSVTSIGKSVFYGCTSLSNITIPYNVKSIGWCAFYGCTSLENVTIPDSVTSIESGTFSYCTSLASVTIPDSVESLGWGAFQNCTSLESITIPDSVIKIDYYAFSGCSGLMSITIPDSVTSIGDCAFRECSSLTEITYCGSINDWNAISFGSSWHPYELTVIHCTDGDIVITN